MNRPIFALVVRSLRLQIRSGQGAGLRLALGLLMLMVLWPFEASADYSGAPGLNLLNGMAFLAAIASTVVGIGWFASAITEEKEEGCLGLLRLAGLSPLSILLGKSLARLWEALLLLGMLLPPTVLAVTLGGVSLTQVLAVFATLVAHVLFIAGLGLLMSVLCQTAKKASSATGLALAGFWILPWILMGLLETVLGSGSGAFLKWITDLSVWGQLDRILSTGGTVEVLNYQVVGDVVVCLACVGLAWLLFPRFAIDSEGGSEADAPAIPFSLRMKRWWRLGGSSRPASGLAALTWKDFNFLMGGRMGMVLRSLAILIAVGVVVVMILANDSTPELLKPTARTLLISGLILGAFDLAGQLSHLLADELRQQTASSLALLPHPLGRIVWAKAQAIPKVLIPSLLAITLGTLLNAEEVLKGLANSLDEVFFWMFLSHVVLGLALCLYYSTVVRHGALGAAVATLMAGSVVEGILTAMATFGGQAAFGGQVGAELILGFWILVQVVVSMVLVRKSIDRFRMKIAAG